MGIKGLMKIMKHDEPKVKPRKYDSVYIDCNYLLHYFIYNCKNDDELYEKTYNYIKYLLETIDITQELNLIFDGKHPHHLQVNPKANTLNSRYKNKPVSLDYDKQVIEPKSKIVSTFQTQMSQSINSVQKMYMKKFKVLINNDYVDEEADFKILNSINNRQHKNICIISRDSDMILIAYSLIIKKNISIDILSSLRPIQFIDVNKLNDGYGLDYVLLILFLGNDYLPKLSNVSYEVIIENYKKYSRHQNEKIISNNKVNYNNLIMFLTYIIVNKKIKFNWGKLDDNRFKKYFNNMEWCLKEYKVIDNANNYLEDTNNVINIYNFIYSLV
jgi:5'-3' exonuclease